MTHKEFAKRVHEISPRLVVDSNNNIWIKSDNLWNYIIYYFRCDEYNSGPIITYIPDKFDAISNLVDEFRRRRKNMTFKEFYDRLYKINKNLTIVRKGSQPVRIFFSDYHAGNPDIYNFETSEYNLPNCDKYLANDMEDVADLIDAYNYDSNSSKENHNLYTKSTINDLYEDWVNNPFVEYTGHLAEILQEKNKAYGDSFSKSIDDYGLKVIGIRLSDKYNRIKHLVNSGELKENDESLEDTLLDNAGYSILAYKYLKEHKKELEDEIQH